MEATDAAEQIQEVLEEEKAERREEDRFRAGVAIFIAVLAMLLTVATLGGDNAATEMVASNIQASDTWAFYQAKNIRQTSYELAADELEATLRVHGKGMAAADRAAVQKQIEDYRAKVKRYDSEPDPTKPNDPTAGEGKKELMARAREWEKKREHSQAQDPNFDYSTALFQIAIVLGSVAILSSSRVVVVLAAALGVVGTVLMLNGFFLWFAVPG